MRQSAVRSARGAALVVSLIMLVLITVLLITALALGTTGFRAVGNMQVRDEVIAAANSCIEEQVTSFTSSQSSSGTSSTPAQHTCSVDINNDGNVDYSVTVTPSCVSATISSTAPPSSLQLPPSMSLGSNWNTVWDIDTTITDVTTGATMHISAGARVNLTQTQRDLWCPKLTGEPS